MNALMAYVSRVPPSSLYRYIDDMSTSVPLPLLPIYDGELLVTDVKTTSNPPAPAASSSGAGTSDAKDSAIQRETEAREVAPFSHADAIDIKR